MFWLQYSIWKQKPNEKDMSFVVVVPVEQTLHWFCFCKLSECGKEICKRFQIWNERGALLSQNRSKFQNSEPGADVRLAAR